jgi:hypothetical protein
MNSYINLLHFHFTLHLKNPCSFKIHFRCGLWNNLWDFELLVSKVLQLKCEDGLHMAQIYDLQNGKGYGMFEIVHEWSTLQM